MLAHKNRVYAAVAFLVAAGWSASALATTRPEAGGDEVARLVRKLHGSWNGVGPCDGDLTIDAMGRYERTGHGPDGNNSSGTWKLSWDSLPPVMIFTCENSDNPFYLREQQVKIVLMNEKRLALQHVATDAPPDESPDANEYTRAEDDGERPLQPEQADRGDETTVGVVADETPAQKELEALAGKWKAISGEREGQPFPEDQLPPLEFELRADGTATATMPPKGEKVELTYAVDPTAMPKAITNTHESGSAKGQKQYGIYKLDDGKLTVCSATIPATEADRPKAFATKGTKHVLFVFERVEGDKE